ncbi:UbiA prenyltransferase domain-containing protein 1, partial [Perkinsus olseni]
SDPEYKFVVKYASHTTLMYGLATAMGIASAPVGASLDQISLGGVFATSAVVAFLYRSDVCNLWRTCKACYEHLHVVTRLWLPNIFLLDGEGADERLAEAHPDSVKFIRVRVSSSRTIKALLPFVPHLSGLGIEVASAFTLELLTESLRGSCGQLGRLWVEFIGHSLALDGSCASPKSINENIAEIGDSCMEVYLACLGGSLPLRITPKIGTRVERLTLAGKLSGKSLECLLSLPHNQLISLDLSRCHLPQWQPFGVYAEIVECHEASLSYMAFKCAPPPTISELASVSGRHPRLLCFPKLVRGCSGVLSVTITDLSPRMTFSSPTGSREKYFARYDHLPFTGWDAFGVFASTFGCMEFERLLESWLPLEDGLKSSWRVTAESVEQRYREYRRFVPVSRTAPAAFDLDVSSASGSEVTELSSSWRGDSDRIGSSSSDGNDSSGSESTPSDELSGTGSSVCTGVSALLAYSLLVRPALKGLLAAGPSITVATSFLFCRRHPESVAICELRVEVFLCLIVDIRMFERYRAARRRSGSDIQSIFRNEVEIARRGTLDSSFGADDDGDSKKEGELNGTPRT